MKYQLSGIMWNVSNQLFLQEVKKEKLFKVNIQQQCKIGG